MKKTCFRCKGSGFIDIKDRPAEGGWKRCCKCDLVKERGEFSNNKTRRDGKLSYCKDCFSLWEVEWRKKNYKIKKQRITPYKT